MALGWPRSVWPRQGLAVAGDLLTKADVAVAERMGRLVVPPTVAMGATLVFEAA